MTGEDRPNIVLRFGKIVREKGINTALNKAIQYITSASFISPQIQYYKYRKIYGDAAPNAHAIIRAPVNEINHLITPRFRELDRHCTYIRGGDWDIRKCTHNLMLISHFHSIEKQKRCIYPIQDYGLFKSSKKHFIDNVPWEKTEFFNWMESKKDSGLEKYKSERFNEFDKLYKTIDKDGYKTQAELDGSDITDTLDMVLSRLIPNDEILINIGRDGNMFLDDGRHRLIVAKLLSLGRVPVRVLVRHKNWQNKRETVADEGISSLDPKFRNHPDIQNMI